MNLRDYFTRLVDCFREHDATARPFNRQYAEDAHHPGDSVSFRVPQRFDLKRVTVNPTGRVKTVMLDNQYTIDLDPAAIRSCRTNEDIAKRVIEPAAKHLASVIQQKKLTVMGQLTIPGGSVDGCVASHPSAGLSVRGLKGYDPIHGNFLRLDILGGRG